MEVSGYKYALAVVLLLLITSSETTPVTFGQYHLTEENSGLENACCPCKEIGSSADKVSPTVGKDSISDGAGEGTFCSHQA